MPDPTSPIQSLYLVFSDAEVVLGRGEHIIGRATECEVCVDDALASRRHAALDVSAEQVTVRDLGSRNGVLVNGEEISDRRALCEGDLITLGAQALTVRRIRREGEPSPTPYAVERALKPAPLARIAVAKRAVSTDDGGAVAEALSTLNPNTTGVGRPLSAFRLIAEAADRAVATGRSERAQMILEAPLLEALATVRAGREIEPELLDIAAAQGVRLAELTHDKRWIDYVHDLYEARRLPLPLAVADRLAGLTNF
jgi:hypothetical protein